MPGSDDGTIISSMTMRGACASAPVAIVAANAAIAIVGNLIVSSRLLLTRLAVIDRVRPHIGGGGDAVRHVEEAGHRRNVPDIAVGKSGAAQPLAIGFFHAPGRGGELDREVEH